MSPLTDKPVCSLPMPSTHRTGTLEVLHRLMARRTPLYTGWHKQMLACCARMSRQLQSKRLLCLQARATTSCIDMRAALYDNTVELQGSSTVVKSRQLASSLSFNLWWSASLVLPPQLQNIGAGFPSDSASSKRLRELRWTGTLFVSIIFCLTRVEKIRGMCRVLPEHKELREFGEELEPLDPTYCLASSAKLNNNPAESNLQNSASIFLGPAILGQNFRLLEFLVDPSTWPAIAATAKPECWPRHLRLAYYVEEGRSLGRLPRGK